MRSRGTDETSQIDQASPLELRRDGNGLRHHLAGRPVLPGTRLELLLEDGSWLIGTYEWRGNEVTWPGFRFRLGGGPSDTSPTPSMVAAIHPGALLRWPAG
jgi:hypothetical protein